MMIMNRHELLAPINDTAPSGEMIRYNPVYREIQVLRNGTADTLIDYKKLADVCVSTLKNSSKDLHVVAILAEAWSNLYGLPGLTEGLNLIADMCDVFWDTLHPNNREDHEGRLSLFIWMNDKLSDVVLNIPMTAPKLPGMPIYTLANLIDARQLELVMQKSGLRRTDILAEAMKENRPTLGLITKSMMITPVSFYEMQVEEISAATAAIQRLETMLDEKFKDESVTLKRFDTYLTHIKTHATEAIETKKAAAVLPTQNAPEPQADTETHEEPTDALAEAIQLPADQLYALLAKIAARLEEIEPKSPAPKLLRKAIEWGNMSTTELFNDLARHDISIAEINKLLG